MALQQIPSRSLIIPNYKRRKEAKDMPQASPSANTTFAQNLMLERSPASLHDPIHVLVVMDGLVELSTETLEWVLKNIASEAYCTITLLGIMPWLNFILSAKTWSKIWSMDLEDLSIVKKKNKRKRDLKYQKVHRLLDLCQEYGVVPEIRTRMGHPLRLRVVEQITSLHASVVVFDKHHDRKNIDYYAAKVPSHLVVMNDDAEVEIIKGRYHFDSADPTPVPSATPTPDYQF